MLSRVCCCWSGLWPSVAERPPAAKPLPWRTLHPFRGALDHPEFDSPGLEINPRHLHGQFVGEPKTPTGTLAPKFVRSFVELKIFTSEFGYMDQPFNEQIIERHEQSEWRDARDATTELFANPFAHELTLEPGLDIARGLVGPPLVGRTHRAERTPGL